MIAAPIGPVAVRRVVHRRRPQKPGSLVLIEAGERGLRNVEKLVSGLIARF